MLERPRVSCISLAGIRWIETASRSTIAYDGGSPSRKCSRNPSRPRKKPRLAATSPTVKTPAKALSLTGDAIVTAPALPSCHKAQTGGRRAAAQRGEPDRAGFPRSGDAIAPALRHLIEDGPPRRRCGTAERERRPGWRINLAAVMHLDDLDVPFRPEACRDLLDQPEQQIDAEAGIGGPDDRHALGGPADRRRLLFAGQSGRADDDRAAEFGGQSRVRRRCVRGREVDRDIAVAQHLPCIPGGGDPDPADPGELTEILADSGAPRLGAAARQLASLARDDIGDQHAAHAAGAPDHPDSGPGHGMPPSAPRTALPPPAENTSGGVCGNAAAPATFPRAGFSSTPA